LVLKISKEQVAFIHHILKSASSEYVESVPECSGKQTNFSSSCTAPVMPTIGTTQNFKLHAHSIDNSRELYGNVLARKSAVHGRLVTSLETAVVEAGCS
jgi:hypothetical protein